MSEVYEHNPEDHEDPLSGPTWLMGVIGAVLLLVIILGLTALYYGASQEEMREKVYTRDYPDLVELRAQQRARLTGEPHWEEREVNMEIVRALVIPIDQAMDLVAEEVP